MSDVFQIRVPIRDDSDVAMARLRARDLALREGLPEAAALALATAVSEVARNIVVHAGGSGEVLLGICRRDGRHGVIATARDAGPGIEDPARALEDGYSSAGSLGLGLPSARRLVDEFELVSAAGRGTAITMTKLVPLDD